MTSKSRADRDAHGAEAPSFDLQPVCASVVAGFSHLAGEVLSPVGLTLVQWSVLERCANQQANTVTALAGCISVDQASISRAAADLVQLGLLQRRRLQQDRRIVQLQATEQGRDLTRQLTPSMQAIYPILLEGISEEELEVFSSIATRVAANVRRHNQRKGGR